MKPVTRVLLRKEMPDWALICLGLLYVVLLGGIDFLAPLQMSFTLFYLLGIAFVAWRTGAVPGTAMAAVSVAAMALDKSVSKERAWDFFWDVASQALVYSAVAWLVARTAKLTRHLESLVEQRRSQYEAILATAMDGFLVVQPDGGIVDVNESFARMLGYTRTELLGMSLRQIEAKEDNQELSRHIETILARGADRFETRHKAKDGHEVDLEVSVTCQAEAPGLMVAFAREIAERKRAEARLRDSEARYRGLAESSPDAILVLDRALRIQYANSAAASLWGSAVEALLGRPQDEVLTAEVAERHTQVAEHVFRSAETQRFDERISFPAGERWIETRLVPVSSPNGAVHSLIVICIDISERKRAEFLLRAQKDLGSSLSQTSDLGTALQALLDVAMKFEGIDCGGVYLKEDDTGDLTLAAHIGNLTPEFLIEAARYPADSDRAALVNRGLPAYGTYDQLPVSPGEAEERSRLRGIAIVPLNYEGTLIGSLNLGSHCVDSLPLQSRTVIEALAAQAAGAIARIRAETERQRLEREIVEISDREQARIGQEIHDGLCQQLVSLAFDANSLHRDLVRGGRAEVVVAARIARYLDEAISEARQLARGLFPVRLEKEGLLSALGELAQATSARFGIDCSFECREPVAFHNVATATHLFRIAQEAVNNAVKHSRAKSITIRLLAAEEVVALEVMDDGVGVREERARRASGMGLAIMNYRARSIGAHFRLSRGPTGGTSISCCIPRPRHQDFDL